MFSLANASFLFDICCFFFRRRRIMFRDFFGGAADRYFEPVVFLFDAAVLLFNLADKIRKLE